MLLLPIIIFKMWNNVTVGLRHGPVKILGCLIGLLYIYRERVLL